MNKNHIVLNENYYVRRRVNPRPYKKQHSVPNGMKVILEFPQPSKDDEKVKQEVKFIMSNALQEQLQKK